MTVWHWYDWPFFSHRTGARWFLAYLPRRLRGRWPFHRYYWRAGEMADIAARVARYKRLFEDPHGR